MPEIACAFPSITATAPTISRMYVVAGDRSRGFATRLKASAKLRAVTAAPVWKRNVRFSSNMYVRPLRETVNDLTTSGTSRVPAAPDSSG